MSSLLDKHRLAEFNTLFTSLQPGDMCVDFRELDGPVFVKNDENVREVVLGPGRGERSCVPFLWVVRRVLKS